MFWSKCDELVLSFYRWWFTRGKWRE